MVFQTRWVLLSGSTSIHVEYYTMVQKRNPRTALADYAISRPDRQTPWIVSLPGYHSYFDEGFKSSIDVVATLPLVIPLALNSQCQAGKLNSDNSVYVLKMLDLAHNLCLQQKVNAMVTGPVQKSIINQAGFSFTGHTEYLADKTGSSPVMMLATEQLRVALATTHLPLKDVSKKITRESLTQTLVILDKFLKQQAGKQNPKILVCGLNPHAGEEGNLGDEEINTITPVIKKLKQQNMNLLGPLPADTLFTPKYLKHADAVLAMYHDQGLPVLKYSGFGRAVNITLGLPFIRTSVDHGTALDLAGTGKASNSSLIEAIKMAIEYCGQ